MSEKKEHKIVSASTGAQVSKKAAAASSQVAKKPAAPVGNATPLRIGAILLWLLAIGFEVLAVLVTFGKIDLKFMPTLWQMIAFLVLDLICLIIGSQLWKKANHIKPASEKNKAKFWLWNNMGLIVTVLAFVPFIILLLTNKNADKKMKVVGTVAAVIMLLIGGLASYDWNPVSKEQLDNYEKNITGNVYWTNSLGGKKFHLFEDCQSLNQTEELVIGSVAEAVAANRSGLCAFCARRDNRNVETGAYLDGSVETLVEAAETELETPEQETEQQETEQQEAPETEQQEAPEGETAEEEPAA